MLYRRAFQAILSREKRYNHLLSSWNKSLSCLVVGNNFSHGRDSYQFSRTTPSDGSNQNKQILFKPSHSFRSYLSTSTSSPANDAAKEEPSVKPETLEFQAETRQLLDIVTHSLYTDKEVFLRELISNASDALEKLRHLQNVKQETKCQDADLGLEIRIDTDELNGTISITDTGIGMNRQDMMDHLGTIARSGSKAFINELAQQSRNGQGGLDMDPSRGIIGKFGVGFYSAFMVGEKVEVRSKPAFDKDDDVNPLVWSSEGVGTYEISKLAEDVRQDRGSTVVIHLKDDQMEYADEKRVEAVLKKYSNFVNFPIYLNGNRLNTINAIWADEPGSVTDEQYSEFYKYIAHAFDEPLDRLHYRADAPLDIKALFFIPSFHSEKYGMGRMEPSVSLYSRKVLIEAKSPTILPDWMRFVKGVVDSEDLPLSVSREKAQDSALIAKLRKALTRKFINHLSTMARKNPDKYKDEFYKEYAFFLKEGVCQDYEFQEPLSKLLYYETSKTMNGEVASLEEYVSRCTPEQKEIYYLCAPSRELAVQSPYLEAFEKSGKEVIFVYSAIDDFVMANLDKFQGRKIISAEKGDLDLGDVKDDKDDTDNETKETEGKTKTRLNQKEADEFCAWFQVTLKDKVAKCKVTNRLVSSPAVVTDNESGAMRRMMQLVETQEGGAQSMELPKQQVEINAKHPIITGLFTIREKEPELAKVLAEQIFDNCLMAAGLLDDGRSMLGRLNDILLCVVKDAESK
jgi:HSP90 family molecular chaperone